MECIGKDKSHQNFAFGVKRELGNFGPSEPDRGGTEKYLGHPCDGDTLKAVLQQASKILEFKTEMAIYDLDYRDHNEEDSGNVYIVNRFRKRVSHSPVSGEIRGQSLKQ